MKYNQSTLEYFTNLNKIMNGEIQHGAGRTRTKTKVKHIGSILQNYSLKKSFIDKKFKNIYDDDFEHYRDVSIIRNLVKVWSQDGAADDESISDALQRTGLKKSMAKDIEYAVSVFENTYYTDEQLLEIAIEYHFGDKYAPIGEPGKLFLYNDTLRHEWFTYKKQKVYNIPMVCGPEAKPSIVNIIGNIDIDKKNNTFFYHATDWKSAKDILVGRISHNNGEECLDFGTEPSFYVGLSVDDAIDWASRKGRFSGESAVIIFSIPKIFPLQYKKKDLNGDEWTSVLLKSRRCYKHNYEDDDIEGIDNYEELPELRTYDFVYGNMVENCNAVNKGDTPRTHRPPKKQLASKTDKADAFLQTRILGFIFFQKRS